MSSFNKKSLQDKLHRLNSSQESVETLSHWIIHHKQYAEDSVKIWKETFKESDPEKRLLLFYLANDVVQNSRRKGVPIFISALKPHLLDAALFASGQKIQTAIERIFKIWRDRKVYEKRFIDELRKRLTMGPDTVIIKLPSAENLPIRDVPDFKASTLCDALDDMQKFESDLHLKASVMSKLRLDVADTRSLSLLKDKSAGGKFLNEFNENCAKLQDYCDSLAAEVDARKDIIHLLTDAYTSCTASISQLVQTIKEYKDADNKIGQLHVMFQMRLQSCDDTGTARRDVITEEIDMELDSDDEEIDDKLDRAYENSQKQTSPDTDNSDYRIRTNDSLLKAAAATVPQMDTLSLLKAIADTGALISPALQTQLEFLQHNKQTSFVPAQQMTPSNMLQHGSSELDQPKPSVQDRLNKLIAHKNVALTNLQSITESQTPNQMNQFSNPYTNTLMSPPTAYMPQEHISEQGPPSGQCTPLLDEAPDIEEHKTPNQYNQFASYTQGLYKPIAPSPDMNKEVSFDREFFISNETKKPRMEAPLSLNLKVFDYKHGTSVKQPNPIQPHKFNNTLMPHIPQPSPLEPPHSIAPLPTHSISPIQHTTPPYRPMMNQPHNINLPTHLLNQPPPPSLNLPPNNQAPPYRMPDLSRHGPNMNHSATSPSNEDRKLYHGQNPRFQTPPPHPSFFRPPLNLLPPGNRPPPHFNFRMPPPNEPPRMFSRPHPPFQRPPHNFQRDYHRHNL